MDPSQGDNSHRDAVVGQGAALGTMCAFSHPPLSFDRYRYLAKKAMAQTTDYHLAVFAQVFLLLSWNPTARCDSISSIMFQHVSWELDSMVIAVPPNKADNSEISAPLRFVASPTLPEICPILWLGVFIWCGSPHRSAQAMLFEQPHKAQKRFSQWLRAVLSSSAAELGDDALKIGQHSLRKGAANFSAGLTSGPGTVADLPPRFDVSAGGVVTATQWEEILPGYSTHYPECFQQALPYLLASLVHHRDFLRATLRREHPIFLSRLWANGIIDTLAPMVSAGGGGDL
jgi:hypothetical protein